MSHILVAVPHKGKFVPINNEEALMYWVTALQTHQQKEPPRLRVEVPVKSARKDVQRWVPMIVDYFNDDASCLLREEWINPVLIYDEDDEAPHVSES